MIEINIAKDFSNIPGGRYKKDDPYSGEEFRDNILIPKYNEAKEKGEKLHIDMDGCYGFPSCFIEEVFGALVRKTHDNNVLDILSFTCLDEPFIIDNIVKYINVMINIKPPKCKLPPIHVFKRTISREFQPIQGKVDIKEE